MTKFKVLMAGLGVVVLWASAFPAIRVAAPNLGVIGLSVVRLAVASLGLLAVAPLAHVRLPERRHLPLLVAAAFFGMTAYQLLLNAAELHVPAATASIIVAAAPLVSVAIATLFLGEQLTFTRVAGSVVAIGGVVAVSLARSGATVNSALLIAVGAAVAQGVYHPLIKPLLRDRSGLEVATYTMVAGTVMSLPLLPWGWHDMLAASASAWGSALYLALLPSALGFVLWGYAVANLPMATSTSLLYLVPAFAVLIGFVWLGEVPLVGELLGGVVVIAGVVLVSLGDRILARVRGRTSRRSRMRDPLNETKEIVMKLRLHIVGPVVAAAVLTGTLLAHEPQRGEAAPRADAREVAAKSSVNRLPVAHGPGSVSQAPHLPRGFTDRFTSRYIKTGDVHLHAVIGGDGPPLLLIHGWPGSWYYWRHVMPALARDFQVIAVDQRGIGLSDKPESGYDTGTLANDLVGLMDALGHEQFAVAGVDTGMMIGYALAADHPARVARVALGESPLPGITPLPSVIVPDEFVDRLWHIPFNQLNETNEKLVRGREDIFFGAEFAAAAGTKKLPRYAVRYYVDGLSSRKALHGSFQLYRALRETVKQNVDRRMTRRLPMPVLAIGGAESLGESTAETMKLTADDVQSLVVPGGHWLAEQAPKEMIAALTEFLAPYRDGMPAR